MNGHRSVYPYNSPLLKILDRPVLLEVKFGDSLAISLIILLLSIYADLVLRSFSLNPFLLPNDYLSAIISLIREHGERY